MTNWDIQTTKRNEKARKGETEKETGDRKGDRRPKRGDRKGDAKRGRIYFPLFFLFNTLKWSEILNYPDEYNICGDENSNSLIIHDLNEIASYL
jgi:hypothetical protein